MQFAEPSDDPTEGASGLSSELDAEKRVRAIMVPSWLLTAATTSVWYLEIAINARHPWNFAILGVGFALFLGVLAFIRRHRRNQASQTPQKPQPRLVYTVRLGARFRERKGWKPMSYGDALLCTLLIVCTTATVAVTSVR